MSDNDIEYRNIYNEVYRRLQEITERYSSREVSGRQFVNELNHIQTYVDDGYDYGLINTPRYRVLSNLIKSYLDLV